VRGSVDCQMACDEGCEVGPVHCWNRHRPRHKRDWHAPDECDRRADVAAAAFVYWCRDEPCSECLLAARAGAGQTMVCDRR
jgi:hypothetical protein